MPNIIFGVAYVALGVIPDSGGPALLLVDTMLIVIGFTLILIGIWEEGR